VLNGDVIRGIDQMQDIIGHVHTAGCPGRAELDDTQEVQFAPIMPKFLEVDYQGYVGQELGIKKPDNVCGRASASAC
jgi:hydroxypyruvate isomerase